MAFVLSDRNMNEVYGGIILAQVEQFGRTFGTDSDVSQVVWRSARPPTGSDHGDNSGSGPSVMEYALVSIDYGQGPGLTIFPVSKVTEGTLVRRDQPYTVLEVLTKGFREDFGLVLGHFVEMEPNRMRKVQGFQNARGFQLLSFKYCRTESVINQPTIATVVDMIVQGRVKAEVPVEGKNVPPGSRSASKVGNSQDDHLTNQKSQQSVFRVEYDRDSRAEQRQWMTVYACLDFRIRYILDMRPCERKCIGPIIDI